MPLAALKSAKFIYVRLVHMYHHALPAGNIWRYRSIFTNYSKHKRYNESCFQYIRNVAQYIFYDVYTIYGYTPTYDSEGED